MASRLLQSFLGGIIGGLVGLLLAFTYTFDTSTPAGTDSPTEADDRMREIKAAVQERANVDHYWALTGTEVSNADAGKHRQVSFQEPRTTPTTIDANEAMLYTKDANSKAELYWIDEDENELQITSAGSILGSSIGGGTGWLLTAMIADANVTNAKLADDAVDSDEIADDAVLAAHIADSNVLTAAIADANVTLDKLASGLMAAETGTYAGNGADDRTISLTASWTPDFVLIGSLHNNESHYCYWKTAGMNTYARATHADGYYENVIQAFSAGGFQVGSSNHVNQSGKNYAYLAIHIVD